MPKSKAKGCHVACPFQIPEGLESYELPKNVVVNGGGKFKSHLVCRDGRSGQHVSCAAVVVGCFVFCYFALLLEAFLGVEVKLSFWVKN